MFYKLWADAEEGNNDYSPISVHWSQVPDRDEEWKEKTIRNTSDRQFQQEFECLEGKTLVSINNNKETKKLTLKELYDQIYDIQTNKR